MAGFFRRTMAQRSGMTLVELLTAIGIMSLIVLGTTKMMTQCSWSSNRSQTQNEMDNNVAFASETVTNYLIGARRYTCDSDGLGITYYNPPSGIYTTPKAVGPSHRLYISNGSLYSSDNTSKPILSNIPAVDPVTGTTLKMFSMSSSNKFLIIRLAAKKTLPIKNTLIYSAITIRLRPRNS